MIKLKGEDQEDYSVLYSDQAKINVIGIRSIAIYNHTNNSYLNPPIMR